VGESSSSRSAILEGEGWDGMGWGGAVVLWCTCNIVVKCFDG